MYHLTTVDRWFVLNYSSQLHLPHPLILPLYSKKHNMVPCERAGEKQMLSTFFFFLHFHVTGVIRYIQTSTVCVRVRVCVFFSRALFCFRVSLCVKQGLAAAPLCGLCCRQDKPSQGLTTGTGAEGDEGEPGMLESCDTYEAREEKKNKQIAQGDSGQDKQTSVS